MIEYMDEENALEERAILEDLRKSEYKRSKLDYLREYDINIRFLSKGCVIKVGCKDVAFSTIKEAMISLNEYVENPEKMQPIWKKVFEQEE